MAISENDLIEQYGTIEDNIKELQGNITQAPKEGFNLLFVEANHEKGYDYSYVLCYPNTQNIGTTLVMDCLNDYEKAMPIDKTENKKSEEAIYGLFGDKRISGKDNSDIQKQEESEKESLYRLSHRLRKATNHLTALVKSCGNAPIMIPLIPGYSNGDMENIISELGNGVAKDLAPQIVAMIEDAQSIIEERTGTKMNDKIFDHGHSKSALFANNFGVLAPEKCETIMLGGGEYATLPVDYIGLQVVEDGKKDDSEKFDIVNGLPCKKITEKEFNEIIEEYKLTKKDYQEDIQRLDDGTYLLPMNYPLGIADIDQYIDLSKFDGGKEEYRDILSTIPRVLYVGENEEAVIGHFSYIDGEDIEVLKPYEEEKASMHNRVLRYIAATRALFGRSSNERLENYMQLATELEMPVQSKIYENVGHVDISSSQDFIEDCSKYYEGIDNGRYTKLGDNGRVDRINPVHQLIRRYLVSKTQEEYDKKVEFLKEHNIYIQNSKNVKQEIIHGEGLEILLQQAEEYINSVEYDKSNNENKAFDNLTTDELKQIIEEREKSSKDEVSISKNIATTFAKENDVIEEKENSRNVLSDIEQQLSKENKTVENEK